MNSRTAQWPPSEPANRLRGESVTPSGLRPLQEMDVLVRRLNRWKAATHRYARQLEVLGAAPDREFWINRFLRAATKAGRASVNYVGVVELGSPVITGPCFGPWCLPFVRRRTSRLRGI